MVDFVHVICKTRGAPNREIIRWDVGSANVKISQTKSYLRIHRSVDLPNLVNFLLRNNTLYDNEGGRGEGGEGEEGRGEGGRGGRR